MEDSLINVSLETKKKLLKSFHNNKTIEETPQAFRTRKRALNDDIQNRAGVHDLYDEIAALSKSGISKFNDQTYANLALSDFSEDSVTSIGIKNKINIRDVIRKKRSKLKQPSQINFHVAPVKESSGSHSFTDKEGLEKEKNKVLQMRKRKIKKIKTPIISYDINSPPALATSIDDDDNIEVAKTKVSKLRKGKRAKANPTNSITVTEGQTDSPLLAFALSSDEDNLEKQMIKIKQLRNWGEKKHVSQIEESLLNHLPPDDDFSASTRKQSISPDLPNVELGASSIDQLRKQHNDSLLKSANQTKKNSKSSNFLQTENLVDSDNGNIFNVNKQFLDASLSDMEASSNLIGKTKLNEIDTSKFNSVTSTENNNYWSSTARVSLENAIGSAKSMAKSPVQNKNATNVADFDSIDNEDDNIHAVNDQTYLSIDENIELVKKIVKNRTETNAINFNVSGSGSDKDNYSISSSAPTNDSELTSKSKKRKRKRKDLDIVERSQLQIPNIKETLNNTAQPLNETYSDSSRDSNESLSLKKHDIRKLGLKRKAVELSFSSIIQQVSETEKQKVVRESGLVSQQTKMRENMPIELTADKRLKRSSETANLSPDNQNSSKRSYTAAIISTSVNNNQLSKINAAMQHPNLDLSGSTVSSNVHVANNPALFNRNYAFQNSSSLASQPEKLNDSPSKNLRSASKQANISDSDTSKSLTYPSEIRNENNLISPATNKIINDSPNKNLRSASRQVDISDSDTPTSLTYQSGIRNENNFISSATNKNINDSPSKNLRSASKKINISSYNNMEESNLSKELRNSDLLAKEANFEFKQNKKQNSISSIYSNFQSEEINSPLRNSSSENVIISKEPLTVSTPEKNSSEYLEENEHIPSVYSLTKTVEINRPLSSSIPNNTRDPTGRNLKKLNKQLNVSSLSDEENVNKVRTELEKSSAYHSFDNIPAVDVSNADQGDSSPNSLTNGSNSNYEIINSDNLSNTNVTMQPSVNHGKEFNNNNLYDYTFNSSKLDNSNAKIYNKNFFPKRKSVNLNFESLILNLDEPIGNKNEQLKIVSGIESDNVGTVNKSQSSENYVDFQKSYAEFINISGKKINSQNHEKLELERSVSFGKSSEAIIKKSLLSVTNDNMDSILEPLPRANVVINDDSSANSDKVNNSVVPEASGNSNSNQVFENTVGKQKNLRQPTLKEFLATLSKRNIVSVPKKEKPLADLLSSYIPQEKKNPVKQISKKRNLHKKIIEHKALPLHFNKKLFEHFCHHKVTREAFLIVQQASEIFFSQFYEDISIILNLNEAKNVPIDRKHIYSLMKRLKLVNSKHHLHAMMQELLSTHEWKDAIPIMYPFNNVKPITDCTGQ